MARSLRLLMTTDAVGGVWTYSVELATALAPLGIEIVLANMGPRPTAAQQAEVKRLPHVELVSSDYALEWMTDPWDQVDEAGEWLLALAQEAQSDLVHLNGYVHAALSWPSPVLVVAHSCVLTWWTAVKGSAAPPEFAEYARHVRLGLQSADLVVAPTEAMLATLGAHYAFSTRSRVIPNCRRGALFKPGEKLPIIFSAGRRWDEAKNTALLEKIAPQLAWPVHLAGAARAAAPEAASSVAHLLGELPSTRLAECLSTASIYAAPALYEPFGLGILEAGLAGCALVLSDLPSLRANWEGAAVFVSPRDDAAWLRALNELAAQPSRRLELARHARARALSFTPGRTAKAYLKAYQTLLPGRAAQPRTACTA